MYYEIFFSTESIKEGLNEKHFVKIFVSILFSAMVSASAANPTNLNKDSNTLKTIEQLTELKHTNSINPYNL